MALLALSSATFGAFVRQTRNSAPRADAAEAPRPSQKVYRRAGARRLSNLAGTYLIKVRINRTDFGGCTKRWNSVGEPRSA